MAPPSLQPGVGLVGGRRGLVAEDEALGGGGGLRSIVAHAASECAAPVSHDHADDLRQTRTGFRLS